MQFTFDQVHLGVPDPKGAAEWYRQYLGATPGDHVDRVLFGGTRFIFLKNERPAPSRGAAIDHVALSFRDLDSRLQVVEGSGGRVTEPPTSLDGLYRSAFIEDPWGTRIEVVQDAAKLGVHHIHLRGADPATMLSWYSTQFGGRTAKLKDRIDGIDMSGVWLLVQRGDAVPSAGHSIDHIGFRPIDVDASVAELKTRNVKITTEPRPLSFPNGVSVRLAFVEAPDGVRIELVQRPE